MTYYPDLSPYEYFPESIPDGIRALNVGWLDGQHQVEVGESPSKFIEELGFLCRDEPHSRTRGLHGCPLEHKSGEETWWLTADIKGETIYLGSAEVRVISRTGEWLIAPNLVYHYVTRHAYLPPADFIEAVTAHRSVSDG